MGTLRPYVIQRLVASGLTLVGVSCIVFVMVRLLPGDPARVIAGLLASEDEVTAVRRQLGLDRALYVQYGHFLVRAVRGDLGLSARTSEPVVREIMARLPATLKTGPDQYPACDVPGGGKWRSGGHAPLLRV